MSKKDIAKEAIEFLPDALEIEQERLPWYGRIGVAWIFIILAAVIAWACTGEVDVIVRAPGHIVSVRNSVPLKVTPRSPPPSFCAGGMDRLALQGGTGDFP